MKHYNLSRPGQLVTDDDCLFQSPAFVDRLFRDMDKASKTDSLPPSEPLQPLLSHPTTKPKPVKRGKGL